MIPRHTISIPEAQTRINPQGHLYGPLQGAAHASGWIVAAALIPQRSAAGCSGRFDMLYFIVPAQAERPAEVQFVQIAQRGVTRNLFRVTGTPTNGSCPANSLSSCTSSMAEQLQKTNQCEFLPYKNLTAKTPCCIL